MSDLDQIFIVRHICKCGEPMSRRQSAGSNIIFRSEQYPTMRLAYKTTFRLSSLSHCILFRLNYCQFSLTRTKAHTHTPSSRISV